MPLARSYLRKISILGEVLICVRAIICGRMPLLSLRFRNVGMPHIAVHAPVVAALSHCKVHRAMLCVACQEVLTV